MFDPTSTSPGSLMPAYPHLHNDVLDITTTQKKIEAMRTMGVPYAEDFPAKANDDLRAQARSIAENLKKDGITAPDDREIIAVIAYLQRLGTDIKAKTTTTAAAAQP
jgi:cytochrome c oxidase cbb3-type subunit I/II